VDAFAHRPPTGHASFFQWFIGAFGALKVMTGKGLLIYPLYPQRQ
jgi:hypothetical protein